MPAPWQNMNRTCKRTATSRPSTRRRTRTALIGFALCLLLVGASCTPIQPVAKIGLIAPFEGLYRETGYAALDAVRAAISDCAPPDADVIPLALDTSAQPQTAIRAAEKMLLDPATAAVIGPFSLDTLSAVAPAMQESDLVWLAPMVVNAGGTHQSPRSEPAWITDLVLSVAALAAAQGSESLYVDGVPQPWRSSVETAVDESTPAIPVEFVALDTHEFDPTLAARDERPASSRAVLWLGQPHVGARIATRLHSADPYLAFWVAVNGDDPVFAAHYSSPGQAGTALFWVSWAPPQYNVDGQPAPGLFTSYSTYTATCHALAALYDVSDFASPRVRLQAFRLDENGLSEPIIEP